MIDKKQIEEFLKVNSKGYLIHRESQTLEFKKNFNLSALDEYLRDFAAFANNKGGYMIFGIEDNPRKPIGMNESSIKKFYELDQNKISEKILDVFDGIIDFEIDTYEKDGKTFGIIRIHEAKNKPIISKKNSGKHNEIREAEIYFRYGARTQKIKYPELESIINERIDRNNKRWQNLFKSIAQIGPENVLLLDTENKAIHDGKTKIIIGADNLIEKIDQFKKEPLKGNNVYILDKNFNVQNLNPDEIIKVETEDLISKYPYSAMEMARKVKERLPNISVQDVWKVIKENNLKENPYYSAYNFRNKKQKERYEKEGILPNGIPSIYNENAINYIVQALGNQKEK